MKQTHVFGITNTSLTGYSPRDAIRLFSIGHNFQYANVINLIGIKNTKYRPT